MSRDQRRVYTENEDTSQRGLLPHLCHFSDEEIQKRIDSIVLPKDLLIAISNDNWCCWDVEFAGEVTVQVGVVYPSMEEQLEFVVKYGKSAQQMINEIPEDLTGLTLMIRKSTLQKFYSNNDLPRCKPYELTQRLVRSNIKSLITVEYSSSWIDYYHIIRLMKDSGAQTEDLPQISNRMNVYFIVHSVLQDMTQVRLEILFRKLFPGDPLNANHHYAYMDALKLCRIVQRIAAQPQNVKNMQKSS